MGKITLLKPTLFKLYDSNSVPHQALILTSLKRIGILQRVFDIKTNSNFIASCVINTLIVFTYASNSTIYMYEQLPFYMTYSNGV